MQLELHKLLQDVLSAVREIESYVAGIEVDGFLNQDIIQSAVERKFEIIGEALNRIQRSNPKTFRQISDAQRIIDFRNILAHGYDIIDPALVWDIIVNHLPLLKTETEKLLD